MCHEGQEDVCWLLRFPGPGVKSVPCEDADEQVLGEVAVSPQSKALDDRLPWGGSLQVALRPSAPVTRPWGNQSLSPCGLDLAPGF